MLTATLSAGTTSITGCLADAGVEEAKRGVEELAIVSSPAGFDDDGFNDDALSGLEEAAAEYGFGIRTIQETDPERYEAVQADAAEEGYDLVVCASEFHTDALSANATAYPDQNWMLLNDAVDGAENVSGWIGMNNELSFLAGVVAGVMTEESFRHGGSRTDPEESTVGFVGSEETPLLTTFERSYVQGAKWANDDVEVLSGYARSFETPRYAERVAARQFNDGADVVWHAAPGGAEGVFSAAERNGRFVLGVDTDQSTTAEEYAEVVLGSAIKAVGMATYRVAESVVEGEFEEVVGEQTLSLDNDGIGFVPGRELEDDLPDRVLEAIDDAEDAIAEGRVEFACGPTDC